VTLFNRIVTLELSRFVTLELSRDTVVHGKCSLPEGYILVRVPANALISVKRPADSPPQSNHVFYNQDAKLVSTYNIPKLIISLVQAIWAISTLYQARGNQINQYGYAAFGLTVTPYAFMSVLNIIANILNPEYPAVYLIRTPLMDEAEINGGRFQGEIQIEPDSEPEKSTALRQTITGNLPIEIEIGFLLGLIPLAIVGGLSHFQAQYSTQMERGFTMSWLVLGIIYGTGSPYPAPAATKHRRARRERPIHPLQAIIPWYQFKLSGAREFLFSVFNIFIPGAATVGGMVVVGNMIGKFGICTLITH